MSFNRFWFSMVLLASLVACIYFVNPARTASLDPRARLFGFALYTIPSEAMSPTIKSGDNIFVKTFVYFRQEPTVGDIVVYRPPHQNSPFVGRVMGLAGDKVSVIDSIVHINGKALTEPYITPPGSHCPLPDFSETTVPDSSLFVLGDNRCNSADSRLFGWVLTDKVIGKATSIWKASDASRIGKIQ